MPLSKTEVALAVRKGLELLTKTPTAKIPNDAELAADLGMDSLTAVKLIVIVEEELGVQLPPGGESHLVGMRTTADLVIGFQRAFGLSVEGARVKR